MTRYCVSYFLEMRFLKLKIALATASRVKALDKPKKTVPASPPTTASSSSSPVIKKRVRVPGSSSASQASLATKNIVKNYGKAICTFAVSHLALPYLHEIVGKHGLSVAEFVGYINTIKDSIDGLYRFRSIIMADKGDSEDLKAKKRVFVAISEVFIKNFSVNWIFHSKVFHKQAHLRFRFKMLRRIQNPQLFTYLKHADRKSRSMKSFI